MGIHSRLSRFFLIVVLGLGITFVHAAIAEAETKVIMITPMGFVPHSFHVNKGDHVQLVIRNTDRRKHNFKSTQLKLTSRDLQKGEMTSLEFRALQKGSFRFFSDSPGYPETGFSGTIYVR
jgi:plastocyanin